MGKIIWSLLLLFFAGNIVFGQLPDSRMTWEENPLEWNDFSGKPDENSPFDASTNSGISYSWSLRSVDDTAEFLYTVDTFFYPDLSWVKPVKKSPDLLAHEQLHFDITELHGRKLRQIMSEYSPDPLTDIKKVLERIYQRNEDSRRQMQEKYDRETNHGQNQETQANWEIRIKSELDKLKEFSS